MDHLKTDTISLCDLAQRKLTVQLTDLYNLSCGKFFCHSTFLYSILHIISRCAQPQMFWINASWIVTNVANIKTRWIAPPHFVGEAMRYLHLFSNPNTTIAARIFRPSPYPAVVSLIYVLKEIKDRISIAFSRTKMLAPTTNLRWNAIELLATSVTFYQHLKPFLSDVKGHRQNQLSVPAPHCISQPTICP